MAIDPVTMAIDPVAMAIDPVTMVFHTNPARHFTFIGLYSHGIPDWHLPQPKRG